MNAELMRSLGIPLDRVHLLGWHNAAVFARHAASDSGSYIWREINRENSDFASPLQLAAMIADVYDLIGALFSSLTKSRKRMKPYPRPWKKAKETIGKGAIPITEFNSWYYGG